MSNRRKQSLYSQQNKSIKSKPTKRDECVGVSDHDPNEDLNDLKSVKTDSKRPISELVLREAQNTHEGRLSAREHYLQPIQEDEFPFNNPIVVYLNVVAEDDKEEAKQDPKENEKQNEQKLKQSESINKDLNTKQSKDLLSKNPSKLHLSQNNLNYIPREHLHHIAQDKEVSSNTSETVYLGNNGKMAVIGTKGKKKSKKEEERPNTQQTMAQMDKEGEMPSFPNNTQTNFATNLNDRYDNNSKIRLNTIINTQEPSRQNFDRIKTSIDKTRKDQPNKSFDLKLIKQLNSENALDEDFNPVQAPNPMNQTAIYDTERELDELKSQVEEQRRTHDKFPKPKQLVNQQTQYFPSSPKQFQPHYQSIVQQYDSSLERDYHAESSIKKNMYQSPKQNQPGYPQRNVLKNDISKVMRSTHQSFVEPIEENKKEEEEESNVVQSQYENSAKRSSKKKMSSKDIQVSPPKQMTSVDIQVNSSKDLLPLVNQQKISRDIQAMSPRFNSPQPLGKEGSGSKSQRVLPQYQEKQQKRQQSIQAEEEQKSQDNTPVNLDRELQKQLQDEEVGGARVSVSKSFTKEPSIFRNSLTRIQEPPPQQVEESKPQLEKPQENPLLFIQQQEIPVLPIVVQFNSADIADIDHRSADRDEPMEMDPRQAQELGISLQGKTVAYIESNRDEPMDAEPEYFQYLQEKKKKEQEEKEHLAEGEEGQDKKGEDVVGNGENKFEESNKGGNGGEEKKSDEPEEVKSIQKMIEKYDKLELEIKEVKNKLKPKGLEQFEIEDLDKNKSNSQNDEQTQRMGGMTGRQAGFTNREESKREENKEDYNESASNANYESSPPQFNNLTHMNQRPSPEFEEESKSLNLAMQHIRDEKSQRSHSPEPNYESKNENESHYSNLHLKSKLPLSAIKESSKDKLHRLSQNRAPSFTSTQRKYDKGDNRHKYCALGSLQDNSNSRSRDSSGEKLKSQMLLHNRNLNKLKVPPHRLPPFQPKFQHVDSRAHLNRQTKKKKKDSGVTLDESFDLKQFLQRKHLDPLVVKAQYQNQTQDYDSYPMSNRASIKQFGAGGSNLRNKLDYSTFQYDQVYKELYKKARNKKMADYFQNRDVMFPSNSRAQNQFHSVGGVPNGFMPPNQLFEQQKHIHPYPNQYPLQQHVNHVQLVPLNPSFQKSPNIYNPKDALKDSIIDYKKTYNIVENIKKAYVKNKGNVSYDNMNEREKWEDLIGFMKKNPKVLMQMLPNGDEEEFEVFQEQFFTNPVQQNKFLKRAVKLGFKPKAQLPLISHKNLEKIKKYRNQTVMQAADIRHSQRMIQDASQGRLRQERSLPDKKIHQIDNFVKHHKIRDQSQNNSKLSKIKIVDKKYLRGLASAQSVGKVAIIKQKHSVNRLSKPRRIGCKKNSVEPKPIQNKLNFSVEDPKPNVIQSARSIKFPSTENKDLEQAPLPNLNLSNKDLQFAHQTALASLKSKTFYNSSTRNKDEQTDTQDIVKKDDGDFLLNSLRDDSDNASLFTELNALKQEKEQLKQMDSQIKRDKDKIEKEKRRIEKKKRKLQRLEEAKKQMEDQQQDFNKEKEKLQEEQKEIERLKKELEDRAGKFRKKSSIEGSPSNMRKSNFSIQSQEHQVEEEYEDDFENSGRENKFNSDSKPRFPQIGKEGGNSDKRQFSHSKLKKGQPRTIMEEDENEDNDKVMKLTEQNIEDFKFQENNKGLEIFDEDGISNLAPSDFTGLPRIGSQLMGMKRHSIGRPDSPSGSLKTFNGTTMGPLYDWAYSSIMEDILNNKLYFNHDSNPSFYKEGEIAYTVDMLKRNHHDFRKPHLIQPYYNKALETLREVMSVLNMQRMFVKVKDHYEEVSLQNTFKLLVRCKLMIQARNLLFQTIKDIQRQESLIHDIRFVVDQNLDSSINDKVKGKIEELAQKLPALTLQIKEQIIKLRDEHRIFTKTAATTSKNTFVSNVFVYKKKDALKTSIAAYEEIRKLISVFDIKNMPYISEKMEQNTQGQPSGRSQPL